jgi:membrane protein implicated in regulation of membrane protease activity
MDELFAVCLAEFFAIKGIAFVAFSLVVYLYWIGFKEKREQRRERQWLADKRRELKEKAETKPETAKGKPVFGLCTCGSEPTRNAPRRI